MVIRPTYRVLSSVVPRCDSNGDHPTRTESLQGLAVCLGVRFNKTGVLHELDEAILLHREALELQPGDHPSRADSLGQLAVCLESRLYKTRNSGDLDEIMSLWREKFTITLAGDPRLPEALKGFTASLNAHYQDFTEPHDPSEQRGGSNRTKVIFAA